MSEAEIESLMIVASRLELRAWARLVRYPVTTTSPSGAVPSAPCTA